MSTTTSSLSNTRQFTTFVATSVAKLTFITGKRKSDGSEYSMFEAIAKNTGEVQVIGIGTSLKTLTYKQLTAMKHELFVSDGKDEVSGMPYTVLHLRGERLENDVTNDFA